MISYEGEIVIDRPVAEVFRYTTNFENFPKWTDTHAVKRLTNGPVGVGTRILLDMGKGPMRSRIEFDTVGWIENRSWAFKTISDGSIVWDGKYGFEAEAPSSTKVIMSGRVTLKGWRRLLEPLIRIELRKNEQVELGRLKGLLELGG